MRGGSALHFVQTPALAFHIKHTFLTKIDKEISVLLVLLKLYTSVLYLLPLHCRSHYRVFTSNVKTTNSPSNIRLETSRKE